MTGDDLIHLAGHLAVNSRLGRSDEARYRSAVSRAYYGAFHLVCAFLDKHCGLAVLRNHHGHRQAFEMLTGLSNPAAVESARLLEDLRHERNRADYNLLVSSFRDAEIARQCVEMADSIRSALELCRH